LALDLLLNAKTQATHFSPVDTSTADGSQQRKIPSLKIY